VLRLTRTIAAQVFQFDSSVGFLRRVTAKGSDAATRMLSVTASLVMIDSSYCDMPVGDLLSGSFNTLALADSRFVGEVGGMNLQSSYLAALRCSFSGASNSAVTGADSVLLMVDSYLHHNAGQTGAAVKVTSGTLRQLRVRMEENTATVAHVGRPGGLAGRCCRYEEQCPKWRCRLC
jgi:hypothetical protein